MRRATSGRVSRIELFTRERETLDDELASWRRRRLTMRMRGAERASGSCERGGEQEKPGEAVTALGRVPGDIERHKETMEELRGGFTAILLSILNSRSGGRQWRGWVRG
jgi:hypothetical protein